MNLDSAIRSSGIRVAVRQSLVKLVMDSFGWRRRLSEEARKVRVWELPFVATKNLVKFDERTGDPIYETRVYTSQGQPISLAHARRREDDDWAPLDRVDPITLLSNLADKDEIEARQRRITARKRELGVPEGREWTCRWIGELIDVEHDEDDADDDDDDDDNLLGRIFGGPPAVAPPLPPV